MAVALGLSPREIDAIADSEPELLVELRQAVSERWTNDTELLAGIFEMTHANYRVLLSIAGVKRGDLPEPLKIPRPGHEEQTKTQKKKAANPAEFAQWIKTRNDETVGR